MKIGCKVLVLSSFLFGLGAMEGRALDGEPSPAQAGREDVVGDVRGVLPVMAERRGRVLP